MSNTTERHRAKAPRSIKAAVVTVSDSKFEYLQKNKKVKGGEDTSGKIIVDKLIKNGHKISYYTVIPDDENIILETVDQLIKGGRVEVIITTGGTGISKRDVTIEALEKIFDKRIEGFGEYFRRVSFEKIGEAAILTRATAGVCDGTIVLSLPGSPHGAETGMDIVLKELGHMVRHAREG